MMFTLFLFNHKRKFEEEFHQVASYDLLPLFYDITTRVCCKILDYCVVRQNEECATKLFSSATS